MALVIMRWNIGELHWKFELFKMAHFCRLKKVGLHQIWKDFVLNVQFSFSFFSVTFLIKFWFCTQLSTPKNTLISVCQNLIWIIFFYSYKFIFIYELTNSFCVLFPPLSTNLCFFFLFLFLSVYFSFMRKFFYQIV